jgi:hypothetical protein
MPTNIQITVAELSIGLHSEHKIQIEDGYLHFVSKNNEVETDITIYCFANIPATTFTNGELVFEAKNETQRFYSIYRSGTNLVFVIYSQQNKDEIQQLAILDDTLSNWKIYSTPLDNGEIVPLKYPLGPIIMHYLTVKFDAVMIHASCVLNDQKGRIFTGFSGAGKSTISKIWADAGNTIINDDRLIIRKRNEHYYVYNTPMYYIDVPKKAALDSVFLISHSPQNKIKKISGALAVSKVLAFCIQNNFEPDFIQTKLNLLTELTTQIHVYELGFVPDKSVINFILENETARAK